eukprot:scaffold281025_cov31-Tisochrysis_lutea.AAC.4
MLVLQFLPKYPLGCSKHRKLGPLCVALAIISNSLSALGETDGVAIPELRLGSSLLGLEVLSLNQGFHPTNPGAKAILSAALPPHGPHPSRSGPIAKGKFTTTPNATGVQSLRNDSTNTALAEPPCAFAFANKKGFVTAVTSYNN